MSNWKIGAGGISYPANYTAEDPLDLQGKQPLFDSMDTKWWTLQPGDAEKAVVNAFRATMLSPRMKLQGNAVLYQTLMNVDPHETDPNVFEGIIRDLKARWDEQGQTQIGNDPTDTLPQSEILPGRMQPGIWTNIRRIAALGSYADEIYKAAVDDVQNYGGKGQYFRNRVLQLGIPGVGAKVASFAWLALAPNTSELGTLDVHMMRHLGQDVDSPRNTAHYLQLEDQLRQERDATYGPEVPLSKYQWGVWDKRRTPGFHQDHSPLRPVDPTPYTDVNWATPPVPPRPQVPQDVDPNQLQLAKVGWTLKKDSADKFETFVQDAGRMIGIPVSKANHDVVYEAVRELTRGQVPDKYTSSWGLGLRITKDYIQALNTIAPQLEQLPAIQQLKIPNTNLQPAFEDEYNKEFYNGIAPAVRTPSVWSMVRTGGYSLQGQTVGAAPKGDTQGLAVRIDLQSREEIEEMLGNLPTHGEDYQKQRKIIPDYAINRGGSWKLADITLNPDATGYSYGSGVIVVAEWVDVNDNWLLYHNAVVGIIAGKGGATSHGVVVARERNIPILVNVQGWEQIQPKDVLTMDSTTGIIQGNGGATQEDFGEAQEAEEPVIAYVWSAGHGLYEPIPTGSAGSAALHRAMLRELKQQGLLNKQDYSIGVVYADGHTQQQGEPSDGEALNQWLNTILPAKEPALTG